MSKKNLTPAEVTQIINDYLTALSKRMGERFADETELTYRGGFFHLRSAGLCSEALPIPYRGQQIEAMTKHLQEMKDG